MPVFTHLFFFPRNIWTKGRSHRGIHRLWRCYEETPIQSRKNNTSSLHLIFLWTFSQQAVAGVSRLSSAAHAAREKQKAEMLGMTATFSIRIVLVTIELWQANWRKSEIHFWDCSDWGKIAVAALIVQLAATDFFPYVCADRGVVWMSFQLELTWFCSTDNFKSVQDPATGGYSLSFQQKPWFTLTPPLAWVYIFISFTYQKRTFQDQTTSCSLFVNKLLSLQHLWLPVQLCERYPGILLLFYQRPLLRLKLSVHLNPGKC